MLGWMQQCPGVFSGLCVGWVMIIDYEGLRDEELREGQEVACMMDQRVTSQPGKDLLVDGKIFHVDSRTYQKHYASVFVKEKVIRTWNGQYPLSRMSFLHFRSFFLSAYLLSSLVWSFPGSHSCMHIHRSALNQAFITVTVSSAWVQYLYALTTLLHHKSLEMSTAKSSEENLK